MELELKVSHADPTVRYEFLQGGQVPQEGLPLPGSRCWTVEEGPRDLLEVLDPRLGQEGLDRLGVYCHAKVFYLLLGDEIRLLSVY